jgi:type III secretion protein C
MTRRLFATLLLACLSTAADAGPIPFGHTPVSLTAREQPIADFLQDLFSPLDIPVTVSSSVRGSVNGHFSGPPQSVYRTLARSFNLVEYHDGAVLHIYAPQDLTVRMLPASGELAEAVLRTTQEMQLPDARNTLRVGGAGTLVVSGARRFIEQIEEITRAHGALQRSKPPAGSVKVFYLRYAWAYDVSLQVSGRSTVVPGVASLTRAIMLGDARSRLGPAAPAAAPRAEPQRSRGTATTRKGTLGAPGADPEASSAATVAAAYGDPALARTSAAAAAASTGAAAAAPAEAPAVTPVPPFQDSRVEADHRLNAIIVRDTPERMPLYEQLIASLDVEPMAVEIEATIIDVNTDRLRELGIQWRLSDRHASALVGRGDATDAVLAPGSTPLDIGAQAKGGLLSAVLGSRVQFFARVNALQDRGAAKIVSSPQIITLSNVEALFDSSQTFYVRVAGRDEVDLFNVSAGTLLRVTPHVFKDGQDTRIKLLIAIEDGSISARAVDGLPVVDRSSIDTQAMVFEGESLLIGGITRQSSIDDRTQVPVLGDLPVVGALFRSTTTGASRIERMFLISPRLVPARTGTAGLSQPAAALATPLIPGLVEAADPEVGERKPSVPEGRVNNTQ